MKRKHMPGCDCCDETSCGECIPIPADPPLVIPATVSCAFIHGTFWGGTECCRNFDVRINEYPDDDTGWIQGEVVIWEARNSFSYRLDLYQIIEMFDGATVSCVAGPFLAGTRTIAWEEVWKKRFVYRYRPKPGFYSLNASHVQTCREDIDFERWVFSLSLTYEFQYRQQEYHHIRILSDTYVNVARVTELELPYKEPGLSTNGYFTPRYCLLEDWPPIVWLPDLFAFEPSVCWIASYAEFPMTVEFNEAKTQESLLEEDGELIRILITLGCHCSSFGTYIELEIPDPPDPYAISLYTQLFLTPTEACGDFAGRFCYWTVVGRIPPDDNPVQYNNYLDCPPSGTSEDDQNPHSITATIGGPYEGRTDIFFRNFMDMQECMVSRTETAYGGGRVLIFPECSATFPMMMSMPIMSSLPEPIRFEVKHKRAPRFDSKKTTTTTTAKLSGMELQALFAKQLAERGRESWDRFHRMKLTPESLAEWEKSIPQFGCSCVSKYQSIKENNPPRYDDPDRWRWEIHNSVSESIGNPTFPWGQYYERWPNET